MYTDTHRLPDGGEIEVSADRRGNTLRLRARSVPGAIRRRWACSESSWDQKDHKVGRSENDPDVIITVADRRAHDARQTLAAVALPVVMSTCLMAPAPMKPTLATTPCRMLA